MLKYKNTIGTLIILFLISNLLFGWPIINLYNDFLSAKFLGSLENVTPPNNSKVVNSFKRFGILSGNGNHCDCEIAVILESDMKIKEFESYANKSLSLKAPFSSLGSHHSEIYYIKKQQLFRIYNGDTTELIHNNVHSGYTINKPSEFHLEKSQYNALRDLIENTSQKENKNYFIITAFDQIYEGFSMKDLRCN